MIIARRCDLFPWCNTCGAHPNSLTHMFMVIEFVRDNQEVGLWFYFSMNFCAHMLRLFNYSLVELIHLFILEVNILSTLLLLVVFHTWRGYLEVIYDFLMDCSSLGNTFQGFHDYFIVGGVVPLI
jgi:hypothetical protein